MTFTFAKYQGAGNDFIIPFHEEIDPEEMFRAEWIRGVCHRKLGIGADGVIFLRPEAGGRIRMDFFNCDGSRAGMCGNGLRCAAAYAGKYGLTEKREIHFLTDSGELTAWIVDEQSVRIELPLNEDFHEYPDPEGLKIAKGTVGVPHAVALVRDLEHFDVTGIGKKLRNHPQFSPEGTNVDFLEPTGGKSDPVLIRTYERGVEDETLACGTGIASSAYVLWKFHGFPKKVTFLSRLRMELEVEIIQNGNIVKGMYLTGPAEETFSGRSEHLREQF